MILPLLKVYLTSTFGTFLGKKQNKKGEKQSPVKALLYLLLFAYVFGVFVIMFYGMFSSIAQPYHEIGLDWLYFGLWSIAAVAVMTFMTVFTSKTALFEAKDNDLLISLPISSFAILFCRMVSIFCLALLANICVGVPAIVAYFMAVGFSGKTLGFFAIEFFLLSFLAMALSSILGFIFSIIGKRIKKKGITSAILSLTFVAVYLLFINKANEIVSYVVIHGNKLAEKFEKIYPVSVAGKFVINANKFLTLQNILFTVVPFLICFIIIGKLFFRTVGTKVSKKEKDYTDRPLKKKSLVSSLVSKEYKMFTSSSAYLLNDGLGVVLIVAFSIALFIVRDRVLNVFTSMGLSIESVYVIYSSIICFATAVTPMTAPSICLEGKSFAQIMSFPISFGDIVKAKCIPYFTLFGSSIVFFDICFTVAFRVSVFWSAYVLVMSILYMLFSGFMGLFFGIKHARFDYPNDTACVKNSLPVFISVMICFAGSITLFLAGFLLPNYMNIYYVALIGVAFVLILAVLSALLLLKRGKAYFNRLSM